MMEMNLRNRSRLTARESKLMVTKEEGRWGREESGVLDQQNQTTMQIEKQLNPTVQRRELESASRACVRAQSLRSCPTLCHPIDCDPPGSSVHGILQVRVLAWVAMPSSRGSSQPRDQTHISCISCIAGRFFTI